MRAAVRWLVLLAVVLLIGGHIVYWYWPRERADLPAAGGLAARLLASSEYDSCFWIPYPHQNLAALAGALGDWEGYVAAASRLAGLPPPRLPGFGPFAVPPSSEVVACSEAGGERALVVAAVYPAVALVAKAAGRVAGNPWLAGGEVPDREPPARVSWQGSIWTVRFGDAELPAEADPAAVTGSATSSETGPATSAVTTAALALVRLSRPVSGSFADLPAGTYRLARAGSDLALALAGAEPAAATLAEPEVPAADRPVLLAVGGATAKAPASALALYPAAASALGAGGGNLELPGAATFQPAGATGKGRWSLPGGGIVGFLAKSFPRQDAAGWSIVAFDAASLARAAALAPALARLVQAPANGPALHLGLWVAPAQALQLVTSIRTTLEKVPLVSRREVDRWRDGETLLAPLARCRELALVSAGPPEAFALRLAGCG